MKKVRINLLHFDLGEKGVLCGEELHAVKLSQKQAMQFTKVGITAFDDLLARYGANNRMRVGEYYNGYIVLFDNAGQLNLLCMRGVLQKMEDSQPCVWECVSSLGKGSLEGTMAISDCDFERVSSDSAATALKQKLVKALMTEEKLASLEDEEMQILQEYFGDDYAKCFIEVNY